jgi:hypothetical protein
MFAWQSVCSNTHAAHAHSLNKIKLFTMPNVFAWQPVCNISQQTRSARI